MSDYFVADGALKLKGEGSKKKKKKKKHKDSKKKLEAHTSGHVDSSDDERDASAPKVIKVEMTKAERAFKKMQEKKRLEKIMEKASKSHRQRVEEFNSKLDNLSEHYDIPKVSWTK